VGAFLTAGGDGLYYFHYLPMGLYHGCGGSMGTFGMFTVDPNYQIQQPTSQFFASQLINLEWVQPGTGTHRIFPASSDIEDAAKHAIVTAYAVLRPNGQWSLLVINKDQEQSYPVRIIFHDAATDSDRSFGGTVDVISFGSEQYQWHPSREGGKADPDGPPRKSKVTAGMNTTFTLPKASVTVLRGRLATSPAGAKRTR